MSKPLFKSPECLVSKWPEVFEDLYINMLPIKYIKTIHMEFLNGSIWEINLDSYKFEMLDSIDAKTLEIFEEHQNKIVNLNFDFNISLLKKDIFEKTKKLL